MDTQIITVEVPDGLQNVPFSLELTIPEDCNPATAFVTDKNGCRAPFILSDAFLYGNTGTLTFLIVDSRIKTYYFRCDTGGTRGMPAYSGAVGCGDCLRTAPASVHPLFNGMSAQGFLADIDADGEDELIVTQMYGSVIHRPWHLLNVYRMRDGICGDACPLRARFADGHIDYLHGATHAVCRDGFLYTCGYGTSEEDGTAGAICVYRLNGTFTLDHVGNIPLPPDTGSMTSFQVTEHGIYTAQSRTVKGIKPQDLWFEATEAEIADANWPRWNLESEINFYPYAAAYTLASPISLNIRSHGHMYLDVDPDSGDLYICRSNCNYSALSEHLKTEVVRYARIRDTEFAEAETFEPITSRSPYPITRTRDGRFLCGGGDHGGRLFLDGQPIMQRGPFVNAYAGFAEAEFYGDCILTGCETGFVSLIRRDGEHFTEPERFPVQFSNGPFDDPGSIAEAGLGQTSAYYGSIRRNRS